MLVLAVVCAFLGAIIMASVAMSFSSTYREQYPFFKLLQDERVSLLMVSLVFWVLAYGAKLWVELLSLKPQLESVRVSGGQLAHKATRQCMELELNEAEAELALEARVHLEAAERDFFAKRYRQAAGRFQKSIDVVPTMSGYLNWGVSLMYVWEFRRSEHAFTLGMHIARRHKNREFEGAFLNNLGNAYYREGKYDRALESYRSAIKAFEQTSDSIALSTIFHNSGIVYHAQGKLDEALRS